MGIVFSVAVAVLLGAGELPPGHPPIDGQLPPGHPPTPAMPSPLAESPPPAGGAQDAQALLDQLDKAKDLMAREKTFEIASAMGRLYYNNFRYREAAELLGQAVKKAEPARALYLEQRKRAAGKALPSAEEAGCPAAKDVSVDAQTQKAREKVKAGNAAAAARCALAALEPALDTQELRARALFLLDDAKGAVAEYGRVLEVDDSRAPSLYGRGNVLLDTRSDDLDALKQAKKDFEKLLASPSPSAKAVQTRVLLARVDELIASGGSSKLNQKRAAERRAHPVQVAQAPQGSPPPLSREAIEAVQNTERTPELEQGLDKLMEQGEEQLAHGQFQDALDTYKRVVPFRPDSGRAKAGMAWALVGLNKQPMADRVWGVAVGADPKAVDQLGDMLKSKGDAQGAKALWTKLASTAPEYARQAGLEARLK